MAWPSACLLLSGCRQDMYNQPKAKPYSKSEFFQDGSQRPSSACSHGAIPRRVRERQALYTGLSDEGVLWLSSQHRSR